MRIVFRPQAISAAILALFSLLALPPLSAADAPAPTNPPPPAVTLHDFKLAGDLSGERAVFTLTATARVENRKGGSLELLSGTVALTELSAHPRWRVRVDQNRFVLAFDRGGEFPIQVRFSAAIRQSDGWKRVDFRVAPSALQPVVLQGMAADTQFQFAGAARPDRKGDDFVSFLPSDGTVQLSWKEARPEAEGKLFYATEMLSQISISPGLLRQVALLDGKVMQGELNRLSLLVRGAGEVTRVQGDQVLAWNVEPTPNSADRRLVVRFNQPQKDQFALQVQMQTPLGAFPQAADAMQLRPEGATRFAGYVRIVNDGAVRLEVVQASGLSQISPDQFPESDATRTLLRAGGSQRFAYRFSGADFALRIQADQILPELTVSQVLAYHLGDNELAIDAEIELDVREAPLRDLLLNVPKGYAIAKLNASGVSDYFVREPQDQPGAELRLVYGQPVSGRQVIQLRLERNQPLGAASWALPRIEVARTKSVRGHVGVSADAGFRLTPERTQALTEIATAFFPRQVAGIQSAFRLNEPAWEATLRVERLPQTVQADAFHLFSIGEGIAYGSSVINYLVSGAPVSAFRVELSAEYFNVEFTGKDIRNWQRTTNGYLVQLHTPVSGAYTLLGTYERPFKAQGETLAFTGARPLDAQSEQGHTLVISAYQFQVKPVDVSPGLLPLETGEVPPEYRLFFDAPILAAYRYTSRPFNLRLALSPLAQGDSLSQVVDRASLTTRISKEGLVTDAIYFVKNRGNPNFRLTLPVGTELWSAAVNGAPVVPVTDAKANLIPLPQRADPNAVLRLDLKMAARPQISRRVSVAAPILNAPVMLAQWKLEPDTGQRLVYRKGSLTPAGGVVDVSGFAGLARLFTGDEARRAMTSLVSALLLVGMSVMVWRWTARAGVYKFSARHLSGTVLGLVSFGMAVVVFINLGDLAGDQKIFAPRNVTFLAPVQQPGSALSVEVSNLADETPVLSLIGNAWPALFAVAVWGYGWITNRRGLKPVAWIVGWTLLAWAALRCPNGAGAFLAVVGAFLLLHVVIPTLRRLWQLSRKPEPTPPTETGPAPVVAAILVGGLFWLNTGSAAFARSADFQSAVPQISNLHEWVSSPMCNRIEIGDTAQRGGAATKRGADFPPSRRAKAPLRRGGGSPQEGWLANTVWEFSSACRWSESSCGINPALRKNRREMKQLPEILIDYKSALPGEGADAMAYADIAFPLTPPARTKPLRRGEGPALSPGERERERHSPFRKQPSASRQPAVLPAARPTLAGEASPLSSGDRGRSLSPLPEGEGQGEGEPECSADLQSAVSPNCIRQSVGSVPRSGVSHRLAECNSAIQQSTTLRYDGAPNGYKELESLGTHLAMQLTQASSEPQRDRSHSTHGFRDTRAPVLFAAAEMRATPGDRGQVAETAQSKPALPPKAPPLAESVTQNIRVEEKFALATAKIRWQAVKGQMLPLLFEPAVLTRATFPNKTLKLVPAPAGSRRAQQLLARESGLFDVEVQYQLQVTKRDTENGLALPTQYGLINELNLTLVNLDVDVVSAQAVSAQRDAVGSNTVATLVLSPANDAWISWKPRSRDVKREKAVFYAEVHQLYVPSPGVIEGAHYAALRPAQGELSELIFDVPSGATVTDVVDPVATAGGVDPATGLALKANPAIVSLWRFDPDTRKLRVNLNPSQSRPFALLIRSQVATGPLPVEQSVGLVSVDNAAGQIGLLGLATGNEVQLDTVSADAFSPINLEDFPGAVGQSLQTQIPGLTVRRAFRYADAKASASLKASAVEPDVRVETQDTLSLGEDRIVLAANATVDITRAGIFRLSFLLPAGLEVESISGAALSHWTELKTDAGRVITLHLRGKTEGQQQFAISLAGPGVRATKGRTVPQLVLREASKQRGALLIVPEQGMRLQVATRDGVTQLDPQRSGIRQKGVLAFRVLQTPWSLALDIEQVEPWIQVTSLQHATVDEAQVKVAANLQYQIENTGLKAFRVFLPTNAESVRFQGEQVSDFLKLGGSVTNGLQEWEVKLHRRVIGQFLLQATYQTLMPDQAPETALRGVQAAGVNLQRGFVTVQSGGRLQVRVDTPPSALQPTEWQSIPRALQQDLKTASANFAYRLVEPSFDLPLKLDRHEAAKLLAARVNNITFTSVISDNGVVLTHVRLEIVPGDKRLLHFTLPKDARFWFAFVNQNGVWPWREQDRILIPLEQQSRGGKRAIPVELFYSSRIGSAGARALNLELLASKFDLPLENITWRVYLNENWQLKDWTGTLQLQDVQIVPRIAAMDVETYLQNEASAQREKTKEAEQMLAAGNTALEQGDPQQARRAYQAAYGLSQGDDAFNEDARVQLNNLKLQQALVGLNVRQGAVAGDSDALAGKLRDLRGRKDVNYTQQDAKAIIDRNTAEENNAYMRLAQRLIQQQDAAVSSAAAIHASIPEQGRLLTFKRAVVVDTFADLKIGLEASAVRAASWRVRALILACTLLILALFAWAARSIPKSDET